MAFRHWQGTPPRTAVVWRCPTCGAENTGSLEGGCTACKAGADAKAAGEARAAQQPVAIAQVGELEPFARWWAHALPKGTTRDIAKAAWEAGAEWALDPNTTGPARPAKSSDPIPTGSNQGGWFLAMYDADGDPGDRPPQLDERTSHTVLAALAFYRDNQLSYGPVPGQLSAQEVTELITKLSPAEEPAV